MMYITGQINFTVKALKKIKTTNINCNILENGNLKEYCSVYFALFIVSLLNTVLSSNIPNELQN